MVLSPRHRLQKLGMRQCWYLVRLSSDSILLYGFQRATVPIRSEICFNIHACYRCALEYIRARYGTMDLEGWVTHTVALDNSKCNKGHTDEYASGDSRTQDKTHATERRHEWGYLLHCIECYYFCRFWWTLLSRACMRCKIEMTSLFIAET